MVPVEQVVAALDIGGTKVAAARVEPWRVDAEREAGARPAGVELLSALPTPADGTAEELWELVCSLLDPIMVRGSGSPSMLGVGVGGPMDRGGERVSPLNITAWRGFPLRSRLADRYGVPVRVENDAKALAVGEGRWGAAAGVSDFLAMVVSTGVGGGVVLDGRLLDGASGNAGHVGHMIVEPDGFLCACGAYGCLEAEASGSGIARWSGRPAAEAGPEVRRRTGRLVGRAVASVANLLDLRLAVVAGSVALGFGDEFFAAAQEELDRSALLEFSRGVQIRPAGLGALGPILGAAAVALDAGPSTAP